jgi:hypothetical protein
MKKKGTHTIRTLEKLIGEKEYFYSSRENQKSERGLIMVDLQSFEIDEDLKIQNNYSHYI